MTSASAPEPVLVLLVDDHVIFRAGIKSILGHDRGFVVCGEAGDPETAIALAAAKRPAVILLDDRLGGNDGLTIVAGLRECAPGAAIVVISESPHIDIRTRALQLGAKGLVSKADDGAVLLKAIRRVLDGELWFDRVTVSAAVTTMLGGSPASRSAPEPLTDREREIIALVGEGLKTDAIARRLDITQKTVRNQLTNVYEKLGVSDRLELAIYAYRHGLAKLPS